MFELQMTSKDWRKIRRTILKDLSQLSIILWSFGLYHFIYEITSAYFIALFLTYPPTFQILRCQLQLHSWIFSLEPVMSSVIYSSGTVISIGFFDFAGNSSMYQRIVSQNSHGVWLGANIGLLGCSFAIGHFEIN